MRANPINLLLTGIAVADMLVMLEYIPFATHMYVMEDRYDTYEEKVIGYLYCMYCDVIGQNQAK